MLAALSYSQNPFSFLLVILTGSIDTKITSTASYKKCVYKTRLFDGQKCTQFFNESAHLPLIAFLTMWPFLYFFLFLICSSHLDHIPLLSVLFGYGLKSMLDQFGPVMMCSVQCNLGIPRPCHVRTWAQLASANSVTWWWWLSIILNIIIMNDWSPQFITLLDRGEESLGGK